MFINFTILNSISKMIKSQYKYIFVLFSFLGGCSNDPSPQILSNITNIKIPVNKLQTIKLSDVISEYKAIKLEFTEKSMIQSVRKVLCYKNQIYVLDTFGSKAVLVFNMDGSFVRRIGESGRGPGQYILPQDFEIDSDNDIIEIIGNRQVIKYSLTGKYLNHFTINFTGIKFVKKDGNYYFAVSGKEDFKVICTDLQGRIQDSYVPTYGNYEMGVAFSCFIPQASDKILYRPLRRDTIYSIKNKSITPYRIIDFGDYKFDIEAYNSLPRLEQMKFIKNKKNINQCIIENYFENSQYVHIVYDKSGKLYEYILNKTTGNYCHFGNETLNDDIFWQAEAKWMTGGNEEYIYYNIEPYKFESSNKLKKFLHGFTQDEFSIQAMLEETSNPILLFAKYRI